MNPQQRWQQVNELFHAAAELCGDERSSFLEEGCAGDESLRSEVESLLASDERAGDFIESSPLKIAAELLGENQPCLREGQRIGHYEVVTLVGRGGMGEVYLARDLKLNRKVALKLLPPLFAEDAQRAHRFLQEAQALSTLNHPNIVVVHDANFKGDLHFIITEFIEGETLRQRLARAKPTLSEAFEIVIQIARGLEAAHKAGIIHRDIKPENIMIREDGHVKLLDFGVAKLAERHSILSNAAGQLTSGVYTDSAVIIGTARYMSPEQARGHEVDSRTDIFSLGVILYEIIAGRPPFEGGTVGDIIAVHLTSEPRPLFPEMSPFFAGVERIVARALSKEATERYQHIREFLEDLGRLKSVSEWGDQASVPVEDRPPLRNLPVPEPARDPAENRRTFFAGAAYKARLMTRSASLNPYKWNPRLRFYMASTGLLLLAGLVLLALNTGHSAGVKQPIDSLAVLPLALEEGDTDMQYLSDGITESIISNLSQLSRLKVMSRSSVFQFKGRDISPSDAGRALKVRAVLLGRVARRGSEVVISLELVDTEDDRQLWGSQYINKLAELTKLSSRISVDVADKLRLKLTGKEQDSVRRQHTQDNKAYELYLRGRSHWNRLSKEDLLISIDYYQQAISLDQEYAQAYAGLAYSYIALASNFLPPQEMMAKARLNATRALELDETIADAHYALATISYTYDWNWSVSEAEINKALEYNPNLAGAYNTYSHLMKCLGRMDEAVAKAERALELDPLSVLINYSAGYTYIAARRYEEGIEQLNKTIELDPNLCYTYEALGWAHLLRGHHGQARTFLDKAVKLSKGQRSPKITMALLLASTGNAREAQKILDEIDRAYSQQYFDPTPVASVYGALGKKKEAFMWLERAYETRSARLLFIKIDPSFDSLRSDPRFQDLLRRIGNA